MVRPPPRGPGQEAPFSSDPTRLSFSSERRGAPLGSTKGRNHRSEVTSEPVGRTGLAPPHPPPPGGILRRARWGPSRMSRSTVWATPIRSRRSGRAELQPEHLKKIASVLDFAAGSTGMDTQVDTRQGSGA